MILKPTPQERAMKMQEVLVRALSGELTWIQAADLMAVSVRTMRRWRRNLEKHGVDGVVDRRCRPSPRRVPGRIVGWVIRQYKSRYRGYTVWRGTHCLATYDDRGRLAPNTATAPSGAAA